MASWHYAFLFSSPNAELEPAGAIRALANFGLEFDEFVRPAIEIDELGHLEHGEESRLNGSIPAALEKRLSEQEQFMVECRNNELLFSCSFATRYSNPYIMLGWSKRLFRDLNESRQREYWDMLRKCAKGCKAAHVIIVDDPPDFFEDRFLEIDGQRFLENEMPSGNKYDIHAVWTDLELCDKVPEGIDESSRREIPDGFLEYSVVTQPPA